MLSCSCADSSPHLSFCGIAFLSVAWKWVIVKSLEVLYIPYRMRRSVNVALCEFSYELNRLRGGFVWKVQGILLMLPCIKSTNYFWSESLL